MIKKIKLVTATAVMLLLSACGGGGGGGSATGPTPPPAVDPKITVYQTFDLSRSILTGNSASDGVLQGCSLLSNPATTQINLMNYKFDENRNTVRYNFILDGTFNVPNVASGCNTTGITGTITGVTLMVGGNIAYTISSLAIDAGSFKLGQQIFWGNVLKQTGRLINNQVTSARIECTDSAGKGWYLPLNTVGDISSFFTNTCR